MSNNPYSFITHPERLVLSEAVVIPVRSAVDEVRIAMWVSLVSLLVLLACVLYGV